jgi:hypothetical protein
MHACMQIEDPTLRINVNVDNAMAALSLFNVQAMCVTQSEQW